jgi:hypothetical protein
MLLLVGDAMKKLMGRKTTEINTVTGGKALIRRC